jgi:hypothetical protein
VGATVGHAFLRLRGGSRRGAIFGLIVCAVGCLLMADTAASAPAPDTGRVFREGERLVYDVTWMGIKAGQATLEVRGVVPVDGQSAYHLVTTAQSAPFISAFYRVDDRTESYLGVNPPRALRFEKHLREGHYRHSSFTVYDHDGKVVRYRYLDFSPVPKGISNLEEAEKYGTYKKEEYALAPSALDELSVLYYVRGLPLVEGHTVQAKVFASRKNWDLEVRVLGRETLDTVLGQRDTLMVEPLLKFEGIFQQKGRVIVWLTNDADRIPVLMKSEIKIGSFVSTLVRREVGVALASPQPPKPQAP